MTYKVYRKNNFVEIVDTNNNQVYNYKLADVKINRHDMRNVWYDFYAKGNKIFSKIFLSEIADEAGDPWVQAAFEEFITCNFGKAIIGDSCEGLFNLPQDGENGNYTVTRTFVGAEGGCTNGGVAIELYNGVTDALISTSYACNGADGADGADGSFPTPEAWQNISLDAGWSAGSVTPQYCKVGDLVLLRGSAQKNFPTSSASDTITTLPAGYRPGNFQFFPIVIGLSSPGEVNTGGSPSPFGNNFWMTARISSLGVVDWFSVIDGGLGNHVVYLDGIVFRAEN